MIIAVKESQGKGLSLYTTLPSFQRFIYFHGLYLLGSELHCSSLERHKYINFLFRPKRDHPFSGKVAEWKPTPQSDRNTAKQILISANYDEMRWSDPKDGPPITLIKFVALSGQRIKSSCYHVHRLPVSQQVWKVHVSPLSSRWASWTLNFDFVLRDFSQNRTKKWMFKPHPLATNVTTWWQRYFPKPKNHGRALDYAPGKSTVPS